MLHHLRFLFALSGTLLMSLATQAAFKGTYTINPALPASASNYQNFASVTGDISNGIRTDGGKANGAGGISGPTVFNVADGVYNEAVVIGSPNGASATNTITFQAASGDSSKVIIYPQAILTNYYRSSSLSVSGNFITFKKIEIKKPLNYQVCVYVSTSSSIKFLNCVIINSDNTTLGIDIEYLYGDCEFTNNLFVNGSYAIYQGSNSSNNNIATKINNNIIKNSISGIFVSTANVANSSTTITNNIIVGVSGTGIYLASLTGQNIVTGNTINMTASGQGMVIDNVTSTPSAPTIIANNMVSIKNIGYGPAAGITCYTSPFVQFYFNNVLIYGLYNSGSGAFALTSPAGLSNSNSVYNNNFANYCGGYCINIGTNTGSLHSNYNNYFTTGQYIGSWDNTNYSDLATWTSYNEVDTASLTVPPGYYTNTNLHEKSFRLYRRGIPIKGVTTDFDGDTRYSPAPCIGADEFLTVRNDIALGGVANLYAGLVCGDSASPQILVFNNGSNNLVNIPVFIKLQGASYLLRDTIPAIQAGSSLNFTFKGKLSTLDGGLFTYLAFTQLSNDIDRNNDTATATIFTLATGNKPVVSNKTICHPTNTFLTTKKNPKDVLDWYQYGRVIATGDTLKNIRLDTTSKISVAARRIYHFNAGLKDTSYGNGKYYTFTNGIKITPNVAVNLDTITVYPRKAGSFSILCNGASYTIKVNPSYPGQPIKVPLGISINLHTQALLTIDDISTGGLYSNLYNTKNLNSPNPLVTLSSYNNGDTSLWYFYDLKFSQSTCSSAQVPIKIDYSPITASISPGGATFISTYTGPNPSFYGLENDHICNSTIARYTVNTNYLDSEYNITWAVESLTAKTQHGYSSPDISYTAPSHGTPLTINFSSSVANDQDSIFQIALRLKNLTGGCDSVFYRYVMFFAVPEISIGNTDPVCSGQPITFTATNNSNSSKWDFGDGNTEITGNTATHSYFNNGLQSKFFTVKLMASNSNCSNTDSTLVEILSTSSAQFTYKDLGNLSAVFTASDTGYKHYYWHFSDDSIADGLTTTQRFYTPGRYQVTLTVDAYSGCRSQTSQSVNIMPSGIALPSIDSIHFSIFPNPATSSFNVSYQLTKVSNIAFYLMDMQGKEIVALSKPEQQQTGSYIQKFNLPENLLQGTYILQMRVDGKPWNREIVLSR